MTRRRYIQDSKTGELIEVSTDYTQLSPQSSAYVMPDIQPYQNMADGRWITSRSHHKNLLKQHKLIEIGNETSYLKSKPVQPPPGLKDSIVQAVKKHRGR